MKEIILIETFDGVMHRTRKDAEHHLDVLYSNTMSGLASNLIKYSDGKYQKTKDWLDENISHIVYAKTIKDDMSLISMEEDLE